MKRLKNSARNCKFKVSDSAVFLISEADRKSTRKGAIEASTHNWAMIPGSMGTRSYIVSGKAHPLSFCSAPHGAGRRYSRTKARALFTMDDLGRAMEGIEYRRSNVLLDEIPGAYKDIDEVMAHAADLVEVRHVLKQFVNVKGD